MTTLNGRFASAQRQQEPARALRALAQELVAEGRARNEVYRLFEERLLALRAREESQPAAEAVLEVMDVLSGWCHPGAKL